MKRYFITGTDTDCGKTYVTARLTQFYPRSAAIKPVASGCYVEDRQLISADARQLEQHSSLTMEEITPWRFALPVSPHIAAIKEGVSLKVQEIADYCLNLQLHDRDKLFIEGAGGLLVPLNKHETWVDFLKLTKIPVIMVVGMKLGCINHALLTAAALCLNQIECVGWIANCLDPDMLALEENIDTLKNHLDYPLLSVIPYADVISDMNL